MRKRARSMKDGGYGRLMRSSRHAEVMECGFGGCIRRHCYPRPPRHCFFHNCFVLILLRNPFNYAHPICFLFYVANVLHLVLLRL